MSQGWIKLYRGLLKKPIWIKSTPEQKTILITLLLMANHEANEWEWQGKKFSVNPGQFITSIDEIVKACGKGITTQNVRTALNKFEKYEFLTNESTMTGRLVTIENWYIYQDNESKINKDDNKDLTKSQQRANKGLTPNKNEKNEKNENNIYIVQSEQLWSLYPSKTGKAAAIKKIPKLIKQYSYEQIERCISRYKQYVTNRQNTDFPSLKYQNGSTFFNSGYMDYLDENYKPLEATGTEQNNIWKPKVWR